MNRATIGVIFFLGALVIIAGAMIKDLRKKVVLQKNNISTLQEGMHKFKAKDSLNAVRIGNLIQTREEFKKYNSELVEQLDYLNLSVRKLQTAIKTSSVTEFNQITNVRDTSIVVHDTIKIHVSKYSDKWISFYHRIRNETTDSLHIKVTPNQFHYIFWERKGFWPIRFLKKKKYYLVTKTDNPYTQVDSLQLVNIR